MIKKGATDKEIVEFVKNEDNIFSKLRELSDWENQLLEFIWDLGSRKKVNKNSNYDLTDDEFWSFVKFRLLSADSNVNFFYDKCKIVEGVLYTDGFDLDKEKMF